MKNIGVDASRHIRDAVCSFRTSMMNQVFDWCSGWCGVDEFNYHRCPFCIQDEEFMWEYGDVHKIKIVICVDIRDIIQGDNVNVG